MRVQDTPLKPAPVGIQLIVDIHTPEFQRLEFKRNLLKFLKGVGCDGRALKEGAHYL